MKYSSTIQIIKDTALPAGNAVSEHTQNFAALLRVPAFLSSGGDDQRQDQYREAKSDNRQKDVKLHQLHTSKDYFNKIGLTERMTKLTAQKNTIANAPTIAMNISNLSNNAGIATDARATTPISADIAESRSRWSMLRWNNGIFDSMSRVNFNVKRLKNTTDPSLYPAL